MQINRISYYPQKFKAIHKDNIEKSARSNSGALIHTSHFFRYNDSDEYIVNFLKKLHNNTPLNIISAGCSFGEEVYSYAMALEDLKHKPNIVGIDISQKAIYEAEKGTYMLDEYERPMLEIECKIPNKKPATPYTKELKKRFNQNFELINPKFHEYKKKKDTFKNCSFICGDLIDLNKYFEENSQDAILCRMVLYHMSSDDRVKFFENAFKILKPGGILCVDQFDCRDYHGALIKVGFQHPYNNMPLIYQKPKQEIGMMTYLKQKILSNKSNFDNI